MRGLEKKTASDGEDRHTYRHWDFKIELAWWANFVKIPHIEDTDSLNVCVKSIIKSDKVT